MRLLVGCLLATAWADVEYNVFLTNDCTGPTLSKVEGFDGECVNPLGAALEISAKLGCLDQKVLGMIYSGDVMCNEDKARTQLLNRVPSGECWSNPAGPGSVKLMCLAPRSQTTVENAPPTGLATDVPDGTVSILENLQKELAKLSSGAEATTIMAMCCSAALIFSMILVI
jgi:hypothetical protein